MPSTDTKIVSHKQPELRSQLNEQLRALDSRVEAQVSLLGELQEWVKRRAELHQEYAGRLDKMAKSLQARHKDQKVRREQWDLASAYNCWLVLLQQTRRDARDHAAMAEVYQNNIVPRFTQIQDDVHRIYKRCREIAYESHEELLKVLHELHTSLRTYHTYQADHKAAQAKLASFQEQKAKLQAAVPKEKLEKSKKFRVIEKEIQKRNNKYLDAKLKAIKARNEYLLCMESANSAIHKYFVEDLSDIIDAMDFGLHNSLARALLTHQSGQECFKRSLQSGIDDLQKTITNLDSRLDKQRFLKYNNAAFMLPKKFEFQGHKGDEVCQVQVSREVQEEIEKRYSHLMSRLTGLKTESEENWKTIETAEKTLLEMLNKRDYDVAHYFSDEANKNNPELRIPEASTMKLRADHQETEAFYLNKFREYTLQSNLICRLQSRYELLRRAFGDDHTSSASPTPTRSLAVEKPRRRRIGRTPLMGQPKLFGGSLEEYLEATHQDIPLILRSCIRVINLYGLHHQGIFRVSGSQVEINNFRECFEKLEDPLADVSDASDMNSVAGVLKLYFRELREPLFPTVFFDQFMEIAQLECKQEFVSKVRDVVTSLPRSVFVVMRYLFAFLNHLSEFSDENMMDPYNLAICFGPTLVPIPEDKDQVQYQNLVNELIKNIIIFSEDIFPADGGPTYEKYLSRDSLELEADVGDAPNQGDSDSELTASEDEGEVLEAVAQFDFVARSDRELSFSKGDLLVLHSQVSSDWWRGVHDGRPGLIPDKYILLKIRDEDKDQAPPAPLTQQPHKSELQRTPSSSSLTSSSAPVDAAPTTPSSSSTATNPFNGSAAPHSSQDSGLSTDRSHSPRAASPTPSSTHHPHHHPPHVSTAHSPSAGVSKHQSSYAVPIQQRSSADGMPSVIQQSSSSPAVVVAALQPHATPLHTSTQLHHSTPLHPHHPPLQQQPSSPVYPIHHTTPAPLHHSASLPPSAGDSILIPAATPRLHQSFIQDSEGSQLSSSLPHYTTLPRMHISMPEGGDDGVHISGGGGGGSVTVAHSMIEMREPTAFLEKTGVQVMGGGGTVIAIETAVPSTAVAAHPRRPSLSSSSSDERLNTSTHRTFRDTTRQKIKPVAVGAPDLVMDLPVSSLSSSPREHVSSTSPSPSSSPSPSPSPRARSASPQQYHSLDIPLTGEGSSGTPSPDMTAAECFAKQNQSTLKKTPVTKSTSGVVGAASSSTSNPAAPALGGFSSDAQTQTLLLQAEKTMLSNMKSTSLDVSQLTELKITESGDCGKADLKVTASLKQQRSMDSAASRAVMEHSLEHAPLVEVRSAAPSQQITPNTPRLTARYLQAVAASTGSSPAAPKPQVRVKPTVMKKPSVSPGDSDSDQPSK